MWLSKYIKKNIDKTINPSWRCFCEMASWSIVCWWCYIFLEHRDPSIVTKSPTWWWCISHDSETLQSVFQLSLSFWYANKNTDTDTARAPQPPTNRAPNEPPSFSAAAVSFLPKASALDITPAKLFTLIETTASPSMRFASLTYSVISLLAGLFVLDPSTSS